jgi:PHD/YefM family antitoxin component YafN of YafNO toxin-antitoxin module
MPKIRPYEDLKDCYNEISDFCHENAEPVFITKDGRKDLAVMSIEYYDNMIAKLTESLPLN